MNRIENGWDGSKQSEMRSFHCGPSSQNTNERKGLKKNMRMNKSRKKTLIHTSTCTNTHTHGYTNINTYRYTYHIYTLFIIQVR